MKSSLKFQLIDSATVFSRGRLMNKGVAEAARLFAKNTTLLLTDIDIFNNKQFFQRCQTYTVQKRSVYFPVIWSTKKPRISSSSQTLRSRKVNEENLTQVMDENKETGFWRWGGHGIVCIRASDFQETGGFPEYYHWGSEDTELFKRVIKRGLSVFRMEDPGILHAWHPKTCTIADKMHTTTWSRWLNGRPSTCEKVRDDHY